MNADIPYLRVWVDNSFTTGCPGQEEGYAFAIQSYPARALAFHVMLKSGAHFRNLPIHALALREGAATEELENCQLWDCFSFRPVVTVFAYLLEHEAVCYTRRGPIPGEYLFTVDWLPDSLSAPGWLARPEQAKCAHVLALATGRLAALPTNRVAWKDGYFVGDSPDPRSRGLADEDPGEWLGAFGQAVGVIYEYRWIGEVGRGRELDAADLDLQLDQGDRIGCRAEVLPGVMLWQHNLPAVGHGGTADAG